MKNKVRHSKEKREILESKKKKIQKFCINRYFLPPRSSLELTVKYVTVPSTQVAKTALHDGTSHPVVIHCTFIPVLLLMFWGSRQRLGNFVMWTIHYLANLGDY